MKMLSGLISCEGLTVLANRWPSSPVSSWSAFYVCIQGFPSYKDIIALGPDLMTSFNLNFLFKDLILSTSHWEVLGVRNSAYDFRDDKIQPTAPRCCFPISVLPRSPFWVFSQHLVYFPYHSTYHCFNFLFTCLYFTLDS